MNREQVRIKLQESINWDAFFSLAQDVFQDPGFQSNADNFARATLFEMALEKLSSLPCSVKRVDKNGCDLHLFMEDLADPIRVELKTKRNKLFYKNGSIDGTSGPGDTHAIDMKKKRGHDNNNSLERHQQEKCHDFLLVVQFDPAVIILVDDEDLRPLYYDGGACIQVKIPKDIYTKLDVSLGRTIQRSGPLLSDRIRETYENYIMGYARAQ